MSLLSLALALAFVSQNPSPRWVVLPVHAAEPPPADPTLLRLTRRLAEAVHGAVGEEVRLASREVRDERCPREDGNCPPDVAEMLDTERVVALVLSPKYDAVTVRVFRGTRGLEAEGKLACRWESGVVECDASPLAKILRSGERADPALEASAVKEAFEALRPSFHRCMAGERPNAEAFVTFRARPDGRVIEVRVEPRELQESNAYACMARLVESLRVPAFEGEKPEPFRFSFFEDGSQKATAKQKTKAKRRTKPRASAQGK